LIAVEIAGVSTEERSAACRAQDLGAVEEQLEVFPERIPQHWRIQRDEHLKYKKEKIIRSLIILFIGSEVKSRTGLARLSGHWSHTPMSSISPLNLNDADTLSNK
jgi:hypothetical protein